MRTRPLEPLAEPLSDGVVVVRLRKPTDVAAIAEASDDQQTVRWLHDEPMDAEAQAHSMERVDEAWSSGRAAPLVIADAETDSAVGLVNVQFRDDVTATIAYGVFPASRGRGIAPRAVRLVTSWALGEVGVSELFLEADDGNAASIRVAEKCGFARVDSRTADDGSVTLVFAAR